MFDLAGILLQGPWKPLDELESPELKDLAIRLPRTYGASFIAMLIVL